MRRAALDLGCGGDLGLRVRAKAYAYPRRIGHDRIAPALQPHHRDGDRHHADDEQRREAPRGPRRVKVDDARHDGHEKRQDHRRLDRQGPGRDGQKVAHAEVRREEAHVLDDQQDHEQAKARERVPLEEQKLAARLGHRQPVRSEHRVKDVIEKGTRGVLAVVRLERELPAEHDLHEARARRPPTQRLAGEERRETEGHLHERAGDREDGRDQHEHEGRCREEREAQQEVDDGVDAGERHQRGQYRRMGRRSTDALNRPRPSRAGAETPRARAMPSGSAPLDVATADAA